MPAIHDPEALWRHAIQAGDLPLAELIAATLSAPSAQTRAGAGGSRSPGAAALSQAQRAPGEDIGWMPAARRAHRRLCGRLGLLGARDDY